MEPPGIIGSHSTPLQRRNHLTSCWEYASSVAHVTVPSLKRIFKLELLYYLDNNNKNNDGMNLCAALLSLRTPHRKESGSVGEADQQGKRITCCEYASAVCYSLWLYCEMLLEDYMDRVSGRLLSETSTSEMAIDGRRPPYTTRSDCIDTQPPQPLKYCHM
jgi:hypothetical protein